MLVKGARLSTTTIWPCSPSKAQALRAYPCFPLRLQLIQAPKLPTAITFSAPRFIMKVVTVLSLLATCAAVDYRPGCMTLPKKRHFDNDKCVERIGEAMQSDFAFRIVVDEQNVFVWNEILALANKYDYEFSKSYKTTQALQRVAKKRGCHHERLGRSRCKLCAPSLDLLHALPRSCWTTRSVDQADCVISWRLSWMDGNVQLWATFRAAWLAESWDLGVGLGKGLIEAYEENGQIHVKFKPAGGDF